MTTKFKTLLQRTIAAAFLLAGLGASRANAAETWIEVKCPHFTVVGNTGEKELRTICDQFELFRATFHQAFSTFSVEPGTPIQIIAAKNENTLKQLLPEQYEVKGHTHSIGMYQPGPVKIYVVVNTGAEGDNPYHVLYHEYTHTLVHLSVPHLPLWLDEGIAEYLGNAQLGNKEVRIGLIPTGYLYVLQQNSLLPIETLLSVDHSSPYYNEANRTSVFYAESWALTHYIMLDPRAREQKLWTKFLDTFTKTGDQIAAARDAFGDLKKFQNTLDTYVRVGQFNNGIIKPSTDALDKQYAVRTLSGAESLALRGEFLVNHNRLKEAKGMLDEAIKEEPNLAAAHEAMGMYAYRTQDFDTADREMQKAIQLGTKSFAPFYIRGITSMRQGGAFAETRQESIDSLNAAIKLNPKYAPAYDALASLLTMSDETKGQAVNAAMQAVKLDNTNLAYPVHLVHALLNANRDADAKMMAERIQKIANTPQERTMAEQAARAVEEQLHAKSSSKTPAKSEAANSTSVDTSTVSGATTVVTTAGGVKPATGNSGAAATPNIIIERETLPVDGQIIEAVCPSNDELILTLKTEGKTIRYHVSDASRVEVIEGQGKPAPEASSCAEFKGRTVRIWFTPVTGKDYAGEVTKLYFF